MKLPSRHQPRWSFRRFGLVPCIAPRSERFPDNTIDMGTGYDCFDTLAHTLDPRVQGRQRANRLLLKAAMEAAGFTNDPNEWWHYTLNDEPYPDTYFRLPGRVPLAARAPALPRAPKGAPPPGTPGPRR